MESPDRNKKLLNDSEKTGLSSQLQSSNQKLIKPNDDELKDKSMDKRKKIYCFGAIIFALVGLTIVLILTLRKNDPEPSPNPPGPIPPSARVNPYNLVKDSFYNDGLASIKGHLKADV